MSARTQALVDFFKDKHGQIVIAQWPNRPMLAYGFFTVFSSVLADENLRQYISLAANLALAYWAILELFSGVNRFRQCLGMGVLAYLSTRLIFMIV